MMTAKQSRKRRSQPYKVLERIFLLPLLHEDLLCFSFQRDAEPFFACCSREARGGVLTIRHGHGRTTIELHPTKNRLWGELSCIWMTGEGERSASLPRPLIL